jgi:lipoprotein NlpI
MRAFGMLFLLIATSCAMADEKAALEALKRGTSHDGKREHEKAIEAFSEAIQEAPKFWSAYDRRGDSYLKLGKFTEAIADFDKVIEANPKVEPEHWRRGIAYYYAKKYKEGVKQFETHKTVNPQDVENAAWHYLCNSKVVGKTKAASELIDVTTDPRVPMAEIQKVFARRMKIEDLEKVVIFKPDENQPDKKPDPRFDPKTEVGKEALFYGHLYMALWYDAEGNQNDKVIELLKPAVEKYVISHYMWDVAKVHLEIAKKQKEADDKKKGK